MSWSDDRDRICQCGRKFYGSANETCGDCDGTNQASRDSYERRLEAGEITCSKCGAVQDKFHDGSVHERSCPNYRSHEW